MTESPEERIRRGEDVEAELMIFSYEIFHDSIHIKSPGSNEALIYISTYQLTTYNSIAWIQVSLVPPGIVGVGALVVRIEMVEIVDWKTGDSVAICGRAIRQGRDGVRPLEGMT